jgi:predicted nucleotidyltransferase
MKPSLRDMAVPVTSNPTAQLFLAKFKEWAKNQPGILAVAIVGSYAKGTTKIGSDVDLVIVANEPGAYLADDGWVKHFGDAERVSNEDWGLVQSKRVFYQCGLEVEFGLTDVRWTAVDPIDFGTKWVVNDGIQVIHDPSNLLRELICAIEDRDLERTHP